MLSFQPDLLHDLFRDPWVFDDFVVTTWGSKCWETLGDVHLVTLEPDKKSKPSQLDVAPSQDASGKCRFISGFPILKMCGS